MLIRLSQPIRLDLRQHYFTLSRWFSGWYKKKGVTLIFRERIVTHRQQVNKSSESKKMYWFRKKASASPRQKSLSTKYKHLIQFLHFGQLELGQLVLLFTCGTQLPIWKVSTSDNKVMYPIHIEEQINCLVFQDSVQEPKKPYWAIETPARG